VDFFLYAESTQVLTDWRQYLLTFHPSEVFTSNVSEDAAHKWYKVLRDEAEESAADAEVIAEWKRRGGDTHLRTSVDFRVSFTDLDEAQRAEGAVIQEWSRRDNPTNVRTLLTESGDGGDWILTISHLVFVDARTIAMLRFAASVMTRRFGSRFEGWGAEIQSAFGR
jgi:hypothetical protein